MLPQRECVSTVLLSKEETHFVWRTCQTIRAVIWTSTMSCVVCAKEQHKCKMQLSLWWRHFGRESTNNTNCLLLKSVLIYYKMGKTMSPKVFVILSCTTSMHMNIDCIKISIVYLVGELLKLNARKQVRKSMQWQISFDMYSLTCTHFHSHFCLISCHLP